MAHLVNASYNILGAGGVPTALSEISGHPEDKWGGAVMAALQIKNIPTGAGDDFKIDVSYAKGDTKERDLHERCFAELRDVRRHRRSGAYQSVGFGQTADARLRARWRRRHQAGGCMGCPWCVQPQLGSLLVVQPLGSYAQVRYGGSVLDVDLGQGCSGAPTTPSARLSADYTCNPDYNIAQVGVITRWTPVKNLTFSAEVGAFFLDQKFGRCHLGSCGSQADHRVRVQGPEHCVPERSRSA